MRKRLSLIFIGVVVLSLASGLGLRYALAWTEPGALPPDGNVPKPINVGADDQIKTGGLSVGGNFSVGQGQIVGTPAGGNMGVGTLNAEQLCIQGNCRVNWPEAVNAFVDEGNVGFGPTAVLGTNDEVPLSFETSGVGRMMIGAAGNVGIGTTNTAFNLMVGGVAPRIYLLPAPSSNPELDFGSPAMDTHWSIYRDAATDQLRFWRNDNKLILTSGGNVGISTDNPLYKLTIAGTAPREYLWPSGGGNPELDFGNQAGDTHWSIYRDLESNELRFWQIDNNVTMTAQGDLNSRRCFGPVYVGQTAATYNGARGGYISANALCAATVSGSHVCTTSEILETVKCNPATLPVTDQVWISNGPPGYTARANDCVGWTSTSPSGATIVYGAIWAFDASGGVGWVTTCNQSLKFSCCK